MALMNCTECDNQVSSAAANCPHCGVAIAGAREASAAGAQLVTIQETSKKLKLQTLISVAVVIVGVVWAMGQSESSEPSGIPAILIFSGLVWFIVTRIRIWWHHK